MIRLLKTDSIVPERNHAYNKRSVKPDYFKLDTIINDYAEPVETDMQTINIKTKISSNN
ncbi:hypothetical protein BN8_p06806 (plasmid) [Fibrisoma limi BUZ 3]|uniref:Uncharacterized protein n=1 Tax=Fibrisoma limi BUZ 3 TaxID=1185876 RepID=I2GU09_9BACT|nr:hypothetical protein BN8_p06806 [Fibrisoma limi BUZ 3]